MKWTSKELAKEGPRTVKDKATNVTHSRAPTSYIRKTMQQKKCIIFTIIEQ